MNPAEAHARADLIGGFIQACRACGCPASNEALTSASAGLLVRWSEPGRYYHDSRHLTEVIVAIGELRRAQPPDPVAVGIAMLAAWFHDAVYQTASPEANETASAEIAARDLARLGVQSDAIDAVTGAVLASVDHRTDPRGDARTPGISGRRLFLDADLWILASPADRYAQFAQDVRREYSHVPDATFARLRSGILRNLIDGDGPYITEYARDTWTAPARRNVSGELAALAALG